MMCDIINVAIYMVVLYNCPEGLKKRNIFTILQFYHSLV